MSEIENLKKIIELQDSLIKELTLKSTTNVNLSYVSYICEHEYPSPWFGTVPPNCLKCGTSQGTTVTYRSTP